MTYRLPVLAALLCASLGAAADVLTGIDVLERDGFDTLAGQRIGLVTNHTGLARDGRSTIELLHGADNVALVRLFSPEHGPRGELDEADIGDSRDPATGIPVVSLYGEHRRPTAAMLEGLDTIVFDIQDIGTRFYTYISTMGNAMLSAAEHGKRFVVLDRPNPINGRDVAGPVLDDGKQSFVGFHTLPVRHGMTVGELAMMFRDELGLDLDRIDPTARRHLARHQRGEEPGACTDVGDVLSWPQPQVADDIVAPVPDLAAVALEHTAPLGDIRVLVTAVDAGVDVLFGESGRRRQCQRQ